MPNGWKTIAKHIYLLFNCQYFHIKSAGMHPVTNTKKDTGLIGFYE